MTMLAIVATLLVVVGMAVGNGAGNGAGHGLSHALEVLRKGDPSQKLKALELLARLGDMQVMQALLQALRDPDGRVRQGAQDAMWAIWLRADNDEIEALMLEGIRLMESEEYPEAAEVFTRMIAKAPKFAEGYNKRATVYYLLQDFERSIADIRKTLELNPAHFGALSGMGLCYLGLEEPRQALEWFERAVAINPNMDTIQHYIEQIRAYLKKRSM